MRYEIMLVAKALARYAHYHQSHHCSHTQSMKMMNIKIQDLYFEFSALIGAHKDAYNIKKNTINTQEIQMTDC